MKKEMCKVCGEGPERVENRTSIQEIKGQFFDFISPATVCDQCGAHYYDDEQMTALAVGVTNAYKKANGLLTSDEIVAFRNRLGMTQLEFAEFLKVGVASIRRWEGIGIQDPAMDELIRLKCDIDAIEAAEINLAEKIAPGEFTGQRPFSAQRVKGLIAAFVTCAKSPLFINKAKWLADFIHYKRHGRGLTGSAYRHLDYGPVALNADHYYREMQAEGILEKVSAYDFHLAKKIPLSEIFGADELETIADVIEYVKKVGYKNLPDLSHKEAAWLETKDREFISYEFAKKLKVMKV